MIKILLNFLHVFHLLSYAGLCTHVAGLPCCEWAPTDEVHSPGMHLMCGHRTGTEFQTQERAPVCSRDLSKVRFCGSTAQHMTLSFYYYHAPNQH